MERLLSSKRLRQFDFILTLKYVEQFFQIVVDDQIYFCPCVQIFNFSITKLPSLKNCMPSYGPTMGRKWK